MFTQLLRALAEERPRPLSQIATDLGTDVEGIKLALEQCQRLGYIERATSGCPTAHCAHCPIADPCCGGAQGPNARIITPTWWRLTERGERAAHAGRPAAGATSPAGVAAAPAVPAGERG